MKTYTKGKGKLSHLLGPTINKDDPNFVSWDEEDSQIMSWLWNSMQVKISHTCMFLSMANEIWDAIHQTYLKVRDAAQIYQAYSRQKSMMPNKVLYL